MVTSRSSSPIVSRPLAGNAGGAPAEISWRRPAIQTSLILSPGSNRLPSTSTMLAIRSASIVPRVSSTPSSLAGVVVSASSAASSESPASIALARLARKSPRLASRWLVSAMSTPASSSLRAFSGACFHVRSVRRLTLSALRAPLTSGFEGKDIGTMTGRPVSAISSTLRNSVPLPRSIASSSNSSASRAPRSALISLEASITTGSRPSRTSCSASSARASTGGSFPSGSSSQTAVHAPCHCASERTCRIRAATPMFEFGYCLARQPPVDSTPIS